MDPQVSIVVRSYNRVPALCTLLEQLLAQRHDSFEIVVVEQSTEVAPADAARLAAIAEDPRVRLLEHPPLGGARARNVGVEATRGEIVLFIDDDDLPEGDGWIAAHLANYDDERCLGVSGRQKLGPDDAGPGGLYARLAYRRCLRFSPLLKLPWTYVRHGRRKVPVDAVHGTNGSIRRSAYERFGGWDVDTRIEDEASFGFRAVRLKGADEYFAFDPRPVVIRGLDVPGGLAKRFMSAGVYYERFLDFVHHIVGRYHPVRVRVLYPFYVASVAAWTIGWVWDDSKRYDTVLKRLGGTLAFVPAVPYHTMRCLRRFWAEEPSSSGTGSPSRSSAR